MYHTWHRVRNFCFGKCFNKLFSFCYCHLNQKILGPAYCIATPQFMHQTCFILFWFVLFFFFFNWLCSCTEASPALQIPIQAVNGRLQKKATTSAQVRGGVPYIIPKNTIIAAQSHFCPSSNFYEDYL